MEVIGSTIIVKFDTSCRERGKVVLKRLIVIVSLRLDLCSGKGINKTNVATIRKMLQDPCNSTEVVFERGLQEDEGGGRVAVGAGKEARPSSSLQKASRKSRAHNPFGI